MWGVLQKTVIHFQGCNYGDSVVPEDFMCIIAVTLYCKTRNRNASFMISIILMTRDFIILYGKMEKELVEYLSLILPDFSQSCIDIMSCIFQPST